MIIRYTSNIEEQCSPGIIETISFPWDAERLAWETPAKNIVGRNILGIDFCNIPRWHITKVGFVCNTCIFVPLGCENALCSRILKRDPKPPNPSK